MDKLWQLSFQFIDSHFFLVCQILRTQVDEHKKKKKKQLQHKTGILLQSDYQLIRRQGVALAVEVALSCAPASPLILLRGAALRSGHQATEEELQQMKATRREFKSLNMF